MFAHFSAFQKLACSLASPCKTPKETLDEWKQSTDYVNGVSSKDPYKAEQVNSAPKLTMHPIPTQRLPRVRAHMPSRVYKADGGIVWSLSALQVKMGLKSF